MSAEYVIAETVEAHRLGAVTAAYEEAKARRAGADQ